MCCFKILLSSALLHSLETSISVGTYFIISTLFSTLLDALRLKFSSSVFFLWISSSFHFLIIDKIEASTNVLSILRSKILDSWVNELCRESSFSRIYLLFSETSLCYSFSSKLLLSVSILSSKSCLTRLVWFKIEFGSLSILFKTSLSVLMSIVSCLSCSSSISSFSFNWMCDSSRVF